MEEFLNSKPLNFAQWGERGGNKRPREVIHLKSSVIYATIVT